MSLLARFLPGLSSDPTVRLLRSEPVLVLPAGITTTRVASCVRQWNPGAATGGPGVLLADERLELHGPVSYDEGLWRSADLPADCAVAYAARYEAGEAFVLDKPHYELIMGLCQRVGGRWRVKAGKPWRDDYTESFSPCVQAPRTLAPEELLRLLTPILPGLTYDGVDECYSMETEDVTMLVESADTTTYPLVRMQPWFASATRITQYEIDSMDTPAASERAARVAAAIAEATGGVMLAEYGFPWLGR
jgi:hypothetical protein